MRHFLIGCVLVATCVTGSVLPMLAQQWGTALLVDDYRTVNYIINFSDGAAELGLNRLRTQLELRLQQAGLVPSDAEDSPPFHYLYLHVTVAGSAYGIDLGFRRQVSFPGARRNLSYSIAGAQVWHVGTVGTHGGDPDSIVGELDALLDEFLNAYLTVNQG